MARYTCSFVVSFPLERLPQLVGEILETCNFDIIYDTGDYVMAREVPGGVAFPKLVTVEALIDKTTATQEGVRLNFVIKNEELPLQIDNHCRQMFDRVREALVSNRDWEMIESAAS